MADGSIVVVSTKDGENRAKPGNRGYGHNKDELMMASGFDSNSSSNKKIFTARTCEGCHSSNHWFSESMARLSRCNFQEKSLGYALPKRNVFPQNGNLHLSVSRGSIPNKQSAFSRFQEEDIVSGCQSCDLHANFNFISCFSLAFIGNQKAFEKKFEI